MGKIGVKIPNRLAGVVSKRSKLVSQSLLMDSPNTLVFAISGASQNLKGTSRARVLNEIGIGMNWRFLTF